MYLDRYPDVAASKFTVIENGFDEENFRQAEKLAEHGGGIGSGGCLKLVHSGLLYPVERDPTFFFAAISELKKRGILKPDQVQIILRASGYDDIYRPMLLDHKIDDIVNLLPGLPYFEALAEMIDADGLLLFQAANCNHQIPAKVYEYLRAGRPILALTDPRGDTATVLSEAGIDTIANLDSVDDIRNSVQRFLGLVSEGRGPRAEPEFVTRCTRQSRTAELADLLAKLPP